MALELKNIQENKNPLFNRKEVKADVETDITPNRGEVLIALSKKFSCSEDVINLIRIDSNFGTKIFTIVADIYGSKEAKEAIAVKRKKELEAEKKVEEKVVEQPAKSVEAKPEEKPAEQTEEKVPEQDSETKKTEEKVPEQDSETKDNTQKEIEDVKEESPGQGEAKE